MSLTSETALDHVLLAVEDLAAGAARMRDEHGLTAVPGGRHPGAGTANMIVPLGSSYLELIACVDSQEAAENPLSRRVTGALERGSLLAAWAIRVPDLGPVQARLRELGLDGTGIRDGSRRRPDGAVLHWRSLHVGQGLDPAVPFFIEWDVEEAAYPGAVEVAHSTGEVRLMAVRATSPRPTELAELVARLAGAALPLEVIDGPVEALTEVVLSVDGHRRMIG